MIKFVRRSTYTKQTKKCFKKSIFVAKVRWREKEEVTSCVEYVWYVLTSLLLDYKCSISSTWKMFLNSLVNTIYY